MASHFKQPGDTGGRDSRGHRGATPRRSAGSQGAHLKVRRGGDESYHAPEGNPYAASTPHSADAHYIPVVSGAPVEGRRRSHFAETDPYDLSGRRSRDPKKRVGRIVSVILFVVGVGLIATAAGMWLYNQWNYHQQDVLNEKLATYADVSDNGTTPPQVDWEALKAREKVVFLKGSLDEMESLDSIVSLLGVEVSGDSGENKKSFELGYEDYLYVLLCLLLDSDTLMSRTSNLITLNMNQAQNMGDTLTNLDFKMSETVTAVKSTCKVKMDFVVTPQNFIEMYLSGTSGEATIEALENEYFGYSIIRGY